MNRSNLPIALLLFCIVSLGCGRDAKILSPGGSQPTVSNVFDPLVERGLAFRPGSYAKGSIPSAEYAFISKAGGYYSETVNGDILDNENFESFGYVFVHGLGDIKTGGVLVSLEALRELGYSGAKDAYEAVTQQSNYSFSGHYRVGTDIPAGSYTLRSAGRGYAEVNIGPVGNGDIVSNDNFNGTKSVRAKAGQYLKLSRVSIDN